MTFKNYFDIDVCAGMKEDESAFVALMFHRRHVYEHNGGEVDQKYLDASGDTTVRLKQRIHETQQDTHRLLGFVVRMARNIHGTFHELLPPIPGPVKAFADKKARMAPKPLLLMRGTNYKNQVLKGNYNSSDTPSFVGASEKWLVVNFLLFRCPDEGRGI